MSERPSWDSYFFDLAIMASKRSTCPRRQVGCIFVRNNSVLATGYNGSIVGQEHCDAVNLITGKRENCLIEHGHCIRTVHAEANAIAQAAKLGHALEKAIAYVTSFPCWNCFKLIANTGITTINYLDDYDVPAYIYRQIFNSNIRILQHERAK